ncbi:MAG: hypothetical protein ACPGOV_01625 [Magnetovibrionaceae bacterium]
MVEATAERGSKPAEVNWLLARLDPEVRKSLTPEQTAALEAASGTTDWSNHDLDIRLSVPTPGGGRYLTLVGGRERRPRERRRNERNNRPLFTIGNIFFFFGLFTLMAFGTLILIALYSSVLEF